MIKISTLVEQEISNSPFISEALQEGLINISALARKIQPKISEKVGREVKEGAIIMAIKRMSYGALLFAEKELLSFFRKLTDISVRSNLLAFTFQNAPTLLEKQAQLLDHIRSSPKGFWTFSQGTRETTIIIGENFEKDLRHLFQGEFIIDEQADLSAITLILPVENKDLYGIYYYILKELAYYGINMIELISTTNEFTLIVSKKDLNQSFSILNNLRNR